MSGHYIDPGKPVQIAFIERFNERLGSTLLRFSANLHPLYGHC